MNNKRINILAEGKWFLPKMTKFRNVDDFETFGYLLEDCYVTINSKLRNKGGYRVEVDFSEVPPLYPHKGMHVPKEGIEFADGNGGLRDIGEYGFIWRDDFSDSEYVAYSKSECEDFELKRTLPKTINVCSECFKEGCECATQPSAEPWTDKLKIINWCHKQKEVVLVEYGHEGSYVLWNQYSFSQDRLHKYKWNKINPETNELMYSESKVFCDKECL